MALSDAALDAMANHLASIATHAKLHTGDPGSAGTSNTTTAAREPIAWDAASNGGDMTLVGTELFTGGAASGPVTWLSLWTALTGGTFLGRFALTGDATFNAAGEYVLTEVTITGTAS